MIVHLSSLNFSGIDIIEVAVQVQTLPGIPSFTINGFNDKATAEIRKRVKAALKSIGLAFPVKKILINLASANLVKEESHFDLAIAICLLAIMGILPPDKLKNYFIIGELSLNGSILSINGALPAAMEALSRGKGLICSKSNGPEAAWSGNNNILAAESLIELVNHCKGKQVLSLPEINIDNNVVTYPDFKNIKGQEIVKRALEIAASGGHNLLISCPPWADKSILAQSILGILPKMTPGEMLECTTIASIAGQIEDGKLIRNRPFRAPHYSCSMTAMLGGDVNQKIKPGEVSLAHNGVLFLDDLPEFPSIITQALKQPIDIGEILIPSSNSDIKYPANFQLIAAMNSYKYSYLGTPDKESLKSAKCSNDYLMEVSIPVMDSFDLHIESFYTNTYNYGSIDSKNEESSSQIAKKVEHARKIQQTRYEGYNIKTNSLLAGQLLIDYAIPVDNGKELLNDVTTKFHLPVLVYNRALRVARTIADLDGSNNVYRIHIAEALKYIGINFGQMSLA